MKTAALSHALPCWLFAGATTPLLVGLFAVALVLRRIWKWA
ncbi:MULTISPECIES: hypothetical protein [unclassified Acidovorax]|nr:MULTISPECIES: hypothetical protein [unclassified Acidovorax]